MTTPIAKQRGTLRMRCAAIILAICCVLSGCRRPVEEISAPASSNAAAVASLEFGADDWPWWRGGALDGKAVGEVPPTSWNETENVIWRTDVPGSGHATPVVFGARIFVATADDAQQTQSLLCYGRDDGKLLWDREIHRGGFMHTHQKNTQASATPACDGQHVFCVFMVQDGIWVTATDLDGKILWQRQAGPFRSMHGYGSSPVLYKCSAWPSTRAKNCGSSGWAADSVRRPCWPAA
jgi:outer membrane protein assembly factor BamB